MKIIITIIMDWYIRNNYGRPWTGIGNNQFKSKLCNLINQNIILNYAFVQGMMVFCGKTKLIEIFYLQ